MVKDSEYYEKSWFFLSGMYVPDNNLIEIRGLRYDHIAQAFEAREVFDTSSKITYQAEDGTEILKTPWQKIVIKGRVRDVVVKGRKTTFRLTDDT